MKTKLLSAALAILLLSGCQSVKTPSEKEKTVAQWNAARAGVLASVARSQYESGNLDKALDSTNDALRLTPNDPALHILAGRIALEQGQLELADRELAIARKLDPKSAQAEYLAGIVYQRWQKPDTAYEFYLRASQKDPKELAYILARAEMLVAMNCSPEALSLLKSQKENFEHNAELHQAIGQLLASQGKYQEAVDSLETASMLAPEDLNIREHLAMAVFQNHEYRQAGDIFARLLHNDKLAKRPDLWLALGECQMQLSRTTDARGSFDNATQLDSHLTSAWLSLAKAELALNDTRMAEVDLRKALALDASCAEAHLMLGYTRVRENRLAEALPEFQKASALDQKDPVSLCMVGYVLEKTGKTDQAMKYYAAALKLKPNDDLASRLMASIDGN